MRQVFLTILFFCTMVPPFLKGAIPAIPNPFTISFGTNNTQPQVAANPIGNALAVWTTNFSNQIFASFFNVTTGRWTTQVLPIGIGLSPQIGIDQNSFGIAAWVTPSNFTLQNQILAARFNPPTGTWTTPVAISAIGINNPPVLAVNQAGNAAIAWTEFTGRLFAATFNFNLNRWTAPVQISPNANFPDLTVDQLGNAILIFQNSSNTSIQVLRFSIP